MSRYKDNRKKITALFEGGMSSPKIAKVLEEDTGDVWEPSAIRKYINKWGLRDVEANQFTEALEGANFSNPNDWAYGWLKVKDGPSILIKNKQDVMSFDDMREEFISEMRAFSPQFPSIERTLSMEPHLLVIDIADLHIGKLGTNVESGDPYDVDMAIERAVAGVGGILSKSSGFEIDKILFVIGNDILHTDNTRATTTSGTPQDVSGIWYENFKIARKLYTEIISGLLMIAPVHVVHNPSNHDYVTGTMLADAVYCWFNNCNDVTFDVTIAHRKYFKYGENLIGTSHGDGAKLADIPLLMANEAKDMWANTTWRYVYLHHLHHKQKNIFQSGKDYQGVTVEHLRSPSGTDSWHHRNGYQHSPKAIEGFIHHKEYGQVARITHLFK